MANILCNKNVGQTSNHLSSWSGRGKRADIGAGAAEEDEAVAAVVAGAVAAVVAGAAEDIAEVEGIDTIHDVRVIQ